MHASILKLPFCAPIQVVYKLDILICIGIAGIDAVAEINELRHVADDKRVILCADAAVEPICDLPVPRRDAAVVDAGIDFIDDVVYFFDFLIFLPYKRM